MPGTPLHLGQEAPEPQDSPLRSWFDGWLGYLDANLPTVFIVVVVAVGILVLIRGGIKQAVLFAIGAALVLLLLLNLESVASFLRDELPLRSPDSVGPDQPPPAPSPAPVGD